MIKKINSVYTIFLLALMLRSIAFIAAQPWEESWHQRLLYSGDPFEYITLARSLWERQAFSSTWPEPMPNGFRTPGYPIFLGALSGGQIDLIWIAVLVQIILDSAFAAAFSKIVEACFRSRDLGFTAGVLYSCYPEAIFWSTQIFPENMGVWFAAGGLGFIAIALRTQKARLRTAAFVSGAAAIGLTILIKPNWLLMPMITAFWLTMRAARGDRIGRLSLPVSLILLALPALFWMSWNWYNWGNWTINYGHVAFKEAIVSGLVKKTGTRELPFSANWSHEMDLHCLMPDFSLVNYLPIKNSSVTSWSRDSLSRDKAAIDAQYARLIADNPLPYINMHLSGSAYLLVSPGNNFMLNAFVRENRNPHLHAIFATGGSGFFDLLKQKVFAGQLSVVSMVLAACVLCYLIICYIGSFATLLRAILCKDFFSLGGPWLCYLAFSALNVALIGPGGTSRYRYALMVALLPYAAKFVLKVAQGIQTRHLGGPSA
jgi:hypothetical protein